MGRVNLRDLKKDGVKLFERDYFDGFIYLATNEFWYYEGDRIFIHEINSNGMRYTGPSSCVYLRGTNASMSNNWYKIFRMFGFDDDDERMDIAKAVFDYVSKHRDELDDWDTLKKHLTEIVRRNNL